MNVVDRAKNIILTPKTEWPAIAGEKANIQQILVEYVLPLALISALAAFLGFGFIGRGLGASVRLGYVMGITHLVSAFLGVCITAFVADFLAPNFASEKNLGRAVQLIAYSYTPAWVASILLLLPALGILVTVASLYGIYLLYLGLPYLMKTPQDKVVTYLVVLIIVVVVVYVIIGAVLSPIFMGIFGLSGFSTMRGF